MPDSAAPVDVRTEDPAALREALIDQLRYLIDEVEALKAIVGRVPAPIREGRPTPDALSMKEIYGVIARADEAVHRPHIEQLAAAPGAPPSFAPVPDDELVAAEAWNDRPIGAILDRVQAARRALVEALENLPLDAWQRTARVEETEQNVFALVHQITQDDTRRLRTIGHRLHETNLTGRPKDLPK